MLNPDKSEALFVGTHQQRHAVASVQTVLVAGADLPIALELKSLGVTIDPQLSFESHVREVCRACNFHLRALSHIRNLLSFQVAQTLACSIVCSRLDYCNSMLYGAPSKSISKLQRIQNNLARIVLEVPRRTQYACTSVIASASVVTNWLSLHSRPVHSRLQVTCTIC